MHYRVVADQAAPSMVRRRLKAWLTALGWPPEPAEDLILVVSEAFANVVDHAYPPETAGWARLCAHQHRDADGRCRVVLLVTDQGRWRPAPLDRGYRGRGITLMRALTESLDITSTGQGTQLLLTSYPVAAGASLLAAAGASLLAAAS
ncbi:MAG TPA: ATP-binding protein [Pseudonocardia sp.]